MPTMRPSTGDKPGRTPLSAATALLAFLFAFAALPASAQGVFIIKDSDIQPYRDAVSGFKSACGCAARELEAKGGLAEELAAAHPDAVVAIGTRAFRSIRGATGAAPVISLMVMPSELSAAASDNVSAVSMNVSPEAYLAAISGLLPGVKRIGVLSDPAYTGAYVKEASAAAQKTGLTLIVKTVRDPRQAPALLNELRGAIDVLWMLPDPSVVNPETLDYLMLFSFQNDIPVFSFAKKHVERGAVAALAIDPFDMGVQAGELAGSLLRGGSPARAYARSHRLIVNANVAAKIHARVNREMMEYAEKVE